VTTTFVDIEGLKDAESYFRRVPEVAQKAALLAINQVTQRDAMKMAQDAIYDDVAFPKGYLSGDRLYVSKKATGGDLEAIIVARKRATSLARFAQGQPVGNQMKNGVRVQVKRGSSVHLRRAWLVKLNTGASKDEDNYNIGLALRVNPGESIQGKYSAHSSWLVPGVIALLYGPSVDQIFREVASDISPAVGQKLADEFFRQFDRLL
jgi:hypothetical protein